MFSISGSWGQEFLFTPLLIGWSLGWFDPKNERTYAEKSKGHSATFRRSTLQKVFVVLKPGHSILFTALVHLLYHTSTLKLPISKGAPWRKVFRIFSLSRRGEGFLNWIVQQHVHQNQSSSPWLDWITVAVRDWYPTLIIQIIASHPHHWSIAILIIFLGQLIIPLVMRRCAVQ